MQTSFHIYIIAYAYVSRGKFFEIDKKKSVFLQDFKKIKTRDDQSLNGHIYNMSCKSDASLIYLHPWV